MNKALNFLEIIKDLIEQESDIYVGSWFPLYNSIKLALLKAEHQEKKLKILFEKNVDIEYIKTCFYDEKGGLKEYNSWVGHDEDKELTKEEFNLLKEELK